MWLSLKSGKLGVRKDEAWNTCFLYQAYSTIDLLKPSTCIALINIKLNEKGTMLAMWNMLMV